MRAMIEYGALLAVLAFAIGSMAIAAKGLSDAGMGLRDAALVMVAE